MTDIPPSPAPRRSSTLIVGAAIVVAVFILIYFVGLDERTSFKGTNGELPPEFWAGLYSMIAIAALIERTTQVFLVATGRDAVRVYSEAHKAVIKDRNTGPTAALTALILGLIAASAGIRILDTLVEYSTATCPNGSTCATDWGFVLFRFSDIALSAGILAGGANTFHPFLESLTGTGDYLRQKLRGEDTSNAVSPEIVLHQESPAVQAAHATAAPFAVPAAATTFTISVSRGDGDSGTLNFSHGGTSVSSTCFWDPDNRIAAGTYTGCSKTRMATKTDPKDPSKKRMGIYLPTATSPETGNADIFVHEGDSAAWSDGCLVIPRPQMETLWNAISPSDGRNVIVTVTDS
jgi:hypothetical protein